jgi:hypothetical protein
VLSRQNACARTVRAVSTQYRGLLVSLVAVVALLLASAPAAFASCPTVRFLGVRGSNEHSGFGYTVGDVLATVNHSLSNVNVGNWTDDYWAVNVNPQEPRYNSEYITSVKQGIKNLQAEVQSSARSCSSVPLLIAGYSQGAEVVDDWFLSAEANRLRGHVVGIVLFGDPRFNPAQELPVDKGSFNHRRQGVGPIQFRPAVGTFGTLVNYAGADANMTRSFCVAHDPICNYAGGDMAACSANGAWSFLASCAHLNYQKLKISGSETYTTAAGRFLASRYHAMPRIDSGGGSTGTGSTGTGSTGTGSTGTGSTGTGSTPTGSTGTGSTGSGTPARTYAEAGGVAHTWTNYSNAGGTQGPSIASNQTVQIACWVSGFRVADGNTYWYEIASSPWNDAYYVSADAFYNNGATSGSLLGTPFVDPSVPQC